MKKSVIKTIIAIGFFVVILGVILDTFMNEGAYVLLLSATFYYIAAATILGTAFVFSKNATLQSVGYALCAFAGAFGITFFMNAATLRLTVTPFGLIIMLVGALLQYLVVAIKFFGFIKSDERPVGSDVATVLTKYKELEKEKVISEEEFNDLKSKAIAVNEKDNVSLEDIKKWKKLLDQEVITEAEFADMKAKIFKK